MFVDKIEKFLEEKPGYLKCGAKRIAEAYNAQRKTIIPVLPFECQIALGNVRAKQQLEIFPDKKDLRVLIYDIETSYNIVKSWRIGYNLNLNHGDIIEERKIICVSYKWLGEKEVYNLTWDNNQCDKFLLEQFIEVMNEADILVAHNGDRFDIKWIRTRALYHGLEMLPKYNTFDTLKLAKKKFNFNSNKLDYIAKFLGQEGKIKTEMALWDDVILKQDKAALQKMLDYCDEDVRQLEKVYDILVQHENPKIHVGALNGDKISSPITGSKNLELVKTTTTASGMIKRIMKDLDVNRLFEMSDTNYQKWLKEQ